MKYFFQQISDAITSFSFYQHLDSFPLRKTILMYAVFLLLAAGIRSLPFLTYYLPAAVRQTNNSLAQLATQYPDDLAITWDETTVRSSQSPLSIPFPQNWESEPGFTQTKPLLAYLSTSTPSATPHPDALLTISDTEIFIPLPERGTDAVALDAILREAFTITKTSILDFQSMWERSKTIIVTSIVVTTPVLAYLVLVLQRAFMVIIEATLFYFFRRILGSTWKFSTALQYTICFFIPAEIIDFVAQLLHPQTTFSFFSATVWIYFLAVTFYPALRRLQSKK